MAGTSGDARAEAEHKMLTTRLTALAAAALAMAVPAAAQFDGPAPLAWRYSQPTRVAASGSPLVVNGRVYIALGGRIAAVDQETGNRRWQFPQLDPIEGSFRVAPVAAAGVIVAVGDNKIVYGVDPATGNNLWSLTLPTGTRGNPAVISGKFVALGLQDNSIQIIDASTGQFFLPVPYKVEAGIDGNLGSWNDDLLYFNNRRQLVSLNISSLKPNWAVTFTQLPPGVRPVVYSDTIYVPSGPFVTGVSASGGRTLFNLNTGLALQYPPAVSAAGIFVVGATSAGGIGAVAKAWSLDRAPLTTELVSLNSQPAVAPSALDGLFIAPTTNGALNLFDPVAGRIIWSYVIRPLPDATFNNANDGGPSGPGGFGGPGGIGGGGRAGAGGNQQNQGQDRPVSVSASGAAVLAGKTLMVPAADGTLLAFDKELGVDLTAPRVSLLFPTPGTQVSGQPPLTLVFKIEDEASGYNLSTLDITLDGKRLEYTVARDANIVIQFTQTGPNRPLNDGRREIVVKIKDWLGNAAEQRFGLRIDNTLRPLQLPGTVDPNNPAGGRPGGGGRGGGGLGGDGR